MTIQFASWRDVPKDVSLPLALFLSCLSANGVGIKKFEAMLPGSAAARDVELQRVNKLVLSLYRFEHMAHERVRCMAIADDDERKAALSVLNARQEIYDTASTMADLQQGEKTNRAVASSWRLLSASTDDAEATGHIMHRLIDMVATGIVKSRDGDEVPLVKDALKPLARVIDGIVETVFKVAAA